jgi:hypothetical protein
MGDAMTLGQLHALKVWHMRHWRDHPLEKDTWDAVLTLWLIGCVGGAPALILDVGWAQLSCLLLLFLPSAYVALRRWLHRTGRLRCDWITALR